MKRTVAWTAIALASMALTGCQNSPMRRHSPSVEPALAPAATADAGGTTISAAPPAPAKGATFVDRHPLFYKPRDYYESSGDNKIVKATAATVIGIPAGFLGEMRQIVVGAPATPRY
jgi:hypothetical protein